MDALEKYFEDNDIEEGRRANLNDTIDITPNLFTARGDAFLDETAPSSHDTDVAAPAVDDDPDVPLAHNNTGLAPRIYDRNGRRLQLPPPFKYLYLLLSKVAFLSRRQNHHNCHGWSVEDGHRLPAGVPSRSFLPLGGGGILSSSAA